MWRTQLEPHVGRRIEPPSTLPVRTRAALRRRARRGLGRARAPVLLFLLAGALTGSAGPARAVGVGEPAPDFSLQDLSGATYTLGAYRGKVVLLALVGWG